MATIKLVQFKDLDGNIDFMNNGGKTFTNGTKELIVGEGIFIGLKISVPIDGGTYYFTDTAGDPIDGLETVTLKGSTTRAGTFGSKNKPITAGLKIIVASAVGSTLISAAAVAG
ncbi:hypothetical protein LCGC14_2636730 [marine sediment metagenome]|uniref:Uncharacterized protein n=1 Tax=marine sediment metagenome TaxID=412755 RepID=A0A0F8ZYV4_9ZZZZ